MLDKEGSNGVCSQEEELDDSEYLSVKNKNANRGDEDPELLAPDLLAACKANDERCAQDLLADGASPGYYDPESGTPFAA